MSEVRFQSADKLKVVCRLVGPAMVKRSALIRVISFLLLAACSAFCQKLPFVDVPKGPPVHESDSVEVQQQQANTWSVLPDAPSSVQPPAEAERVDTFANATRSPSILVVLADTAGVMRETELGNNPPRLQPGSTALYRVGFIPEESNLFLSKYLSRSAQHQNPRYDASTSSSFFGRATFAISRFVVMRDDAGERKLNASSLLRVLSSVAISTAYRPYEARSTSTTFKTFGATIGSGVGTNLFQEFSPGIRQMVKGLTPKFVSAIGERLPPVATPAAPAK